MERTPFFSTCSSPSVHSLHPAPAVLLFVVLVSAFCCPASLPAQSAGSLEEGRSHFEAGHLTRAREVFENLVRADRRDAAAAYWLGRTLRAEGEFKDAVDSLEKATELEEGNVTYLRELYWTCTEFVENAGAVRAVTLARRMVRMLHRIVELDPAATEEREQLVGFHVNAPRMFGGGDIDAARRYAEELTALDPKRGRLAFIMIHQHEGENDLVEREYQALISEFPDEYDHLRELGLFYHDTERYAEAIATFQTLTERFPDYLYGWYLVGRSAAVSGLGTETGTVCMEHYLAHEPPEGSPSHAAAHWRLGMIHEKAGNLERARAEYEASLVIDPDYREARVGLRRIRP